MTDDEQPVESKPGMNEILRALRGQPYSEPPPKPTSADVSRALRAGFGRADAPVEQHEAPAGQAPAEPSGPDFGGGSRGVPVPSEPTPDINTLLRSAAGRRRDAFGGINDVINTLYGTNEED